MDFSGKPLSGMDIAVLVFFLVMSVILGVGGVTGVSLWVLTVRSLFLKRKYGIDWALANSLCRNLNLDMRFPYYWRRAGVPSSVLLELGDEAVRSENRYALSDALRRVKLPVAEKAFVALLIAKEVPTETIVNDSLPPSEVWRAYYAGVPIPYLLMAATHDIDRSLIESLTQNVDGSGA